MYDIHECLYLQLTNLTISYKIDRILLHTAPCQHLCIPYMYNICSICRLEEITVHDKL